ncbi:MAG TPA: histidine--tRNA ligase [Mucilaginibacter sp.]
MAAIKPSVPKGTRDFSPIEMVRRNYIFNTIKTVFRKYGYQQIETPSMENLSTLTGKYGEEGDKLMFKILDNGVLINSKLIGAFTNLHDQLRGHHFDVNQYDADFKGEEHILRPKFAEKHKDLPREDYHKQMAKYDDMTEVARKSNFNLVSSVSEKALRYDLTVPFARYVVMHQNEITFPFKRFQVQPVWRADRPQKGRYREFYQCDADVVGSDSLLNEAEFVLIYDEALTKLGLQDFTIKINNRKILSGIAELIDKHDNIIDLTVAIDKLDKIGLDGVVVELMDRGFSAEDIEQIKPVILLEGTNREKLESLREALSKSATAMKGCDEIETVLNYIDACKLQTARLELDITLARGLNYYTGAIFEVKTNEVAMGSIGGGGRYDDLTGMFGLKGLTGVGISFGADRIYDVMDELNLFPEATSQTTRLLICCFDKDGEQFAWPILQQLRNQDVKAELYPAGAKLKKQLDYANNKNIPFTIIIGSEEIESGLLTIKDMRSGVQEKCRAEEIINIINR